MKTAEKKEGDDLFAARVELGLRELDGFEQAPEVSAIVARRLNESVPEARRPGSRWLAAVAALLALAVTTALVVQQYIDRGGSDPDSVAVTQDPVGAWRLVYELPADALQRSLRDRQDDNLEQALARCARNLQTRLGTLGVVARDGVQVTIDLDDASRVTVAGVRAIVEMAGELEMRVLAEGDYAAAGVRFDMPRERKQLQAWLDAGGKERVLQDPTAIGEYHATSPHLRWYVRRVLADERRPGRWSVRFAGRNLGVVAVHADADWNDGVIPAHVQARPAPERFLIELVPINMHEEHFASADLDPTSITRVDEPGGRSGVNYRMRGARVADFAEFSEKWIGKSSAVIWDGEVLTAPMFRSRIPGVGRISALSSGQADAISAALRTVLPASPRLLRSGPRKPK